MGWAGSFDIRLPLLQDYARTRSSLIPSRIGKLNPLTSVAVCEALKETGNRVRYLHVPIH